MLPGYATIPGVSRPGWPGREPGTHANHRCGRLNGRIAREGSVHVMARSAAPQSLGNESAPSIGDLGSQAIRDVTQLVKCELALAKLELREDAKRLGLAAPLLAITAFTGCLILVLLCFAFVYGLVALGIWIWAAFLIVAGVCLLLAAVARSVKRRIW